MLHGPANLLTVLLLVGAWGCSGTKKLETNLGGRKAESLRAEARRTGGGWQVELLLPAGTWKVETEEGQALHVIPGEPRATLRWVVASERWSQQDRLFRFTLIGDGGLSIPMSVRYPHTLPQALVTVLEILRLGPHWRQWP